MSTVYSGVHEASSLDHSVAKPSALASQFLTPQVQFPRFSSSLSSFNDTAAAATTTTAASVLYHARLPWALENLARPNVFSLLPATILTSVRELILYQHLRGCLDISSLKHTRCPSVHTQSQPVHGAGRHAWRGGD